MLRISNSEDVACIITGIADHVDLIAKAKLAAVEERKMRRVK